MSINPPSDILLDVAKAVDPTTSRVATEKLSRLSADGGGADFEAAMGSTSAPATDPALIRSRISMSGGMATTTQKPVDASTKAYKGLEALVLQNLVETMLPKDSEEFFGKGSAGEIWRSMMAQQLGTQLGRKVSLGLAEKTAALHPPLPLGDTKNISSTSGSVRVNDATDDHAS